MSASEKLKALDAVRENAPMGWSWGPAHEGNADWHEITGALVAALPQIVAVVEWAQAPGNGMFCPECGYAQENCPTGCRRRAALAALDEALP